MTEIVKVKAEHIPHIAALERECFSVPWSEESFLSEAENEDAHFCAVYENGELLGFSILHRMFDEGEIFNIAVSEKARRRGIGTALLSEASDFAEKNDIKRIFLEVRQSNKAARCLYAKCGFEVCGLRKNYYTEPKEDAILMVKELGMEH